MKKIGSILLLLSFGIALPVYAGKITNNQQKYAINLFGGFAQTTIRSNISANLGNRAGVAFGLGMDFRISNRLWLGFDILEVEKNFNTDNGVVANYDLTYIEIPVKLRFEIFRIFNIFAGPYLTSYLVSAVRSTQGTVVGTKETFTNDYGITAGAWLGFRPSPKLCLGIEGRYNFGVSDIQNDGIPRDFMNTRSLILMANIRFEFK